MSAAADIARRGFAFDLQSVRDYDTDGHLHVSTANISKAAVNPYVGREIPGWQSLGLDPEKIYNLLRDPKELARGASTFAGKPILSSHCAVDSANHPSDLVVGSVGTSVEFNDPHLIAPVSIWDDDAIRSIKSGEKKAVSAGYSYRADMTPGVFRGQPYDGVMRDLRGNHVALVHAGRIGDDAVIGDADPFSSLRFRSTVAREATKATVQNVREADSARRLVKPFVSDSEVMGGSAEDVFHAAARRLQMSNASALQRSLLHAAIEGHRMANFPRALSTSGARSAPAAAEAEFNRLFREAKPIIRS